MPEVGCWQRGPVIKSNGIVCKVVIITETSASSLKRNKPRSFIVSFKQFHFLYSPLLGLSYTYKILMAQVLLDDAHCFHHSVIRGAHLCTEIMVIAKTVQ